MVVSIVLWLRLLRLVTSIAWTWAFFVEYVTWLISSSRRLRRFSNFSSRLPSLSLQTSTASHHHHTHNDHDERQRFLWSPRKIYSLSHSCNRTDSDVPKLARWRSCNTTEEPCIYDDNKNLVSVNRHKYVFCFWLFQPTSGPQRYFIYYSYLLLYWPYISVRDTRYQSVIRIQERSRIYLLQFSWIWDGRRCGYELPLCAYIRAYTHI